MATMPEVSAIVLVWWAALSAIGVVNLALWVHKARQPLASGDERRQLWLSGIYVLVCAFRSFLPRADVQRICFVDSFWASVFVGRSVATVAELAFITQLSLTGRDMARRLRVPAALALATIPPFLIVVAESCSWYAVLTTNYLGNFIEESLWTLSGALFAAAIVLMRPRSDGALRRLLSRVAVGTVGYVTFMLTVDLRMYGTRLAADRLAGRGYFSLADGLHDVIARRVVTFAWADWHEELAWMFLYFSVSVWFSLSLITAARSWPAQPSAAPITRS
jgi:hypothetical protein